MKRHRAQLSCAMLGAVTGVIVVMAGCSQPDAAAAPAVTVAPTTTAAATHTGPPPRTPEESTTPTRSRRPAADTGIGCGQRAVTSGAFNPACPEYQGYLDPGTAAGRAPTSGERQQQHR